MRQSNRLRAAVFDSGVGGLTVVKSLINSSIFSEIIYYGDTARVPYGNKDENTVIRYSLEVLEFFNNFDVDLMIVACNSASAFALEELRRKAKFSVYGVIEPGVLAVENISINHDENILIIGTNATIKSNLYQEMLKKRGYSNITAVPTPLLVPLVEEGIKDEKILNPIFEHYFKGLPKPKAVIMGCTHFPLLKEELGRYFTDAILIHSGDAIVDYLKREKVAQNNNKKTELRLFASENVHRLKEVAHNWLST